jgi:hypothetical protein
MREAIECMWGWDAELQDSLFDEKSTPENQWIVEVDGHDIGLIAVSRRASEYVLDNIQIAPAHQRMGLTWNNEPLVTHYGGWSAG